MKFVLIILFVVLTFSIFPVTTSSNTKNKITTTKQLTEEEQLKLQLDQLDALDKKEMSDLLLKVDNNIRNYNFDNVSQYINEAKQYILDSKDSKKISDMENKIENKKKFYNLYNEVKNSIDNETFIQSKLDNLKSIVIDDIDKNNASFLDTYYNQSGFNKDGYDRSGFDKSGYNKNGRDKDGYDRSGYDKLGYDRSGWSANKINKTTKTKYDSSGYDYYGYDKDEYDRKGWNSDKINKYTGTKYDKNGYNFNGNKKKQVGDRVSYYGYANNSGYDGILMGIEGSRYLIKVTNVTVNGWFALQLNAGPATGYEDLDWEDKGKLIWVDSSYFE